MSVLVGIVRETECEELSHGVAEDKQALLGGVHSLSCSVIVLCRCLYVVRLLSCNGNGRLSYLLEMQGIGYAVWHH